MKTKILLIYTGGTIGMVNDSETNSLVPLDFKHLSIQVPELKSFDCQLDSYEFDTPIDSSNVNPVFWQKLLDVIEINYSKYNGFVILHGTDTMAHTASALSFMIQNVDKPIILTGSQLPIGTIRTDGKENLITSIEIAAEQYKGEAVIKEVCVCFGDKLFRGNRISKINAEYFNAFSSPNYPSLAEIGIHIHYKKNYFLPKPSKAVAFNKKMDENIAILKVFPGMSKAYVESFANINGLKSLIIETYGSGNAPTDDWFIDILVKIIKKGIIIVNVTQCLGGAVNLGHYETSMRLLNIGIVSAKDMTIEATAAKLMFLLGNGYQGDALADAFSKNLSGEISLE
jgi:L-asparaginase